MSEYRNGGKNLGRALLCAGTALALSAPAFAQNDVAAETQSQPDSGELTEIVVTARQRSENLMTVPDSITAFNSDQMEARGLSAITDIAALTPNVRLIQEQDISTTQVYIRGIGSNRNQASAVAFAVDGVILPDSDAFTVDLSDAERVEILKGPQGALYGKGALAGAVNITTKRPTNELQAEVKGSFGSDDTYGLYAELSGPLAGETLLGRVSVKYNHTDGYFFNAVRGEGADRDRNIKVAARLIFEPSSTISFDLNGFYVDQKSGVPPYMLVDILGTTGGRLTKSLLDQPIELDSPSTSDREVTALALTSKFDFGFATLTSISAYDRIVAAFDQDLDFTGLNVATSAQDRVTRGWSQELRLTSPDAGRLRYILSAYYQNSRRAVTTSADLDFCYLGLIACPTPPLTESGVLITLPLARTIVKDDQLAGSAQINYSATDRFEITAALRYDQNRPTQRDLLNGGTTKTKFDAWQPKLSLSYKLGDATMVYATYSHGYKAGTFNPPQPATSTIPLIVKAERSVNYEAGFKTTLFGNRMRVTAAGYYTDYSNGQQYYLDIDSGGQATINIDKARLYGFEADVLLRATDALTLNASIGVIESEIRNFDGTSDYRGQPLPNTPSYTFNLGGEYKLPIGADTDLTLRADYARFGKTTFQDFQNPNTSQVISQASYDTVDLRASIDHGSFRISAFGRNIFATKYATSAYSRYLSPLIFLTIGGDPVHPATGAIYGVEARVRF